MSVRVGLRPDQPLTLREIEVVKLVAAGMSNTAAAAELGLSPLTVKQHLQRIAVKSGVGDRAGIVGYAIRTGQLSVPATGVPPLGFAERHFNVLVRIARGYSNEQIGAELGLNVHTVKSRVRRLLVLLEVGSREEAVVAGFACGALRLVPRQRVAS